MTRLTDIQLVLLTSAAQRKDGSLLPPPESIAGQAARITKAIASLIKRALVHETEGAEPAMAWRRDGERQFAAFITDAGRTAIGASPSVAAEGAAAGPAIEPEAGNTGAKLVETATAKAPTKTAQVIGLLQRAEGATLDELIAATGWLPHTTRAALTGLRKKGHAIARGKRDEKTCYTLAAAA